MKLVSLALVILLSAGCTSFRPATQFPQYFRYQGQALRLPVECVLVDSGEDTIIHSVDVRLKKKDRIIARLPAGQVISIQRSLYRQEMAQLFFRFECSTDFEGRSYAFILDSNLPADWRMLQEGPNQAPQTTPVSAPR